MTTFEPVFLDGPLPRSLRQTWLRHFNQCPRSAFLAAKHGGPNAVSGGQGDGAGEINTPEMARGSAAHAIFARATHLAMEMNEPTIPPDVVKTLADEVLGEFPVPLEQHDYVREMAFRWASEVAFDPQMIVACESLFQLQVGDWTVRARIDFAEIIEKDHACVIRDYKSSRAAPSFDEVARKMPDGRLVARNFQLVLYALLMRFGVPVVEVDGEERPDPFPIAGGVERMDLEFVYPGIEDREGRMVKRAMTLDRLELEEYRSSLEALVTRVKIAESSGHWPAVVSDQACGECPAPGECPIPQQVRDWRGRINTPEQASEAAMVLDRRKAELRAAQTELRNFAKATGHEIRYGGKVLEFVFSESEYFDHKGFAFALSEGRDVTFEDFLSTRQRSDFKARDLTEEEKADG